MSAALPTKHLEPQALQNPISSPRTPLLLQSAERSFVPSFTKWKQKQGSKQIQHFTFLIATAAAFSVYRPRHRPSLCTQMLTAERRLRACLLVIVLQSMDGSYVLCPTQHSRPNP